MDGYVAKLGLDPEEAKQLFEKATRPPRRLRRSLTQAPHPRMVSTRDELGRALARVWEEDNRPSMQKLEDRVHAAREEDETRKPFAFLSGSAAYRISHRQQLPSNIEQLRAYLYACNVKERQFRIWIQAYGRVKAKGKEEAAAKKAANTEEHGLWHGWKGQRRANTLMLNAGPSTDRALPPIRHGALGRAVPDLQSGWTVSPRDRQAGARVPEVHNRVAAKLSHLSVPGAKRPEPASSRVRARCYSCSRGRSG